MYRLSDLLARAPSIKHFEPLPIDIRPLHVKEIRPRLIYQSNGKITHYGRTIFRHLNQLVPEVWMLAYQGSRVDLNNTNDLTVVWRLDGMDDATLKHLLPTVAPSFAIQAVSKKDISTSTNPEEQILFIQKPSHKYIGSGKLINISSDLDALLKARPRLYYVTPTTSPFPIDNWVVQPLLPTLLWNDRKFDCRFFSVIYTDGQTLHHVNFPYGIGRICVNRYDPLHDVTSAITNVSIQEKIAGYSPDLHMPLLKDDINLVDNIMKEIVDNIIKNGRIKTMKNKLHVMILGLDILFLPNGTPKLIEVNHEPSLEITQSNNEMICSNELIRRVFGQIIPLFLLGQDPFNLPPS